MLERVIICSRRETEAKALGFSRGQVEDSSKASGILQFIQFLSSSAIFPLLCFSALVSFSCRGVEFLSLLLPWVLDGMT